MKEWSFHKSIGKCKLKSKWHSLFAWWKKNVSKKCCENAKCRWECREDGLPIHCNGNGKWYNHSGKYLGRFLKC